MNILHLNTTDSAGGAAIAALRLQDALGKQGVKSHMMVSKKQSNNISVSGLPCTSLSHIHFLCDRWNVFVNNHFSRKNLFQIDTAVSGASIVNLPEFKRADIVHLHWVNQGFLSLKSLKQLFKSGKPVVWTLHDMWQFTALCHYVGDCERYKTHCQYCPLLVKGAENDLSSRVFKRKLALYEMADSQKIHFVAVSSWLAEQARSSKLLSRFPISVIPNVLPFDQFSIRDKVEERKKWNISQDKKVILFGALKIEDERKGLKYLIEALKIMLDKGYYRKEQLQLIIFGGTKNPSILHEIPIEYTFTGFLNGNQQLCELYAAADVAAIPSLYETFGQTVLEAQACGCLPVSFTGSGQMDIIQHRDTGYLAESGSAEDFAEGLNWALNQPENSRNLRTQAYRKFSEDTVSKQYIKLYNSLLKES